MDRGGPYLVVPLPGLRAGEEDGRRGVERGGNEKGKDL